MVTWPGTGSCCSSFSCESSGGTVTFLVKLICSYDDVVMSELVTSVRVLVGGLSSEKEDELLT